MTPLDFLRILSTVSFPATITDEAQLQLVSKLAYLELIDAEISTPGIFDARTEKLDLRRSLG